MVRICIFATSREFVRFRYPESGGGIGKIFFLYASFWLRSLPVKMCVGFDLQIEFLENKEEKSLDGSGSRW